MRPVQLVVAVIMLCAVLAGCGGDQNGSTTVTVERPVAADAVAPEEEPAPEADECESKRITSYEKNPGRCVDSNGVTHIVADKRGVIRLERATVRYVDYEIVKTVDGGDVAYDTKAHGRFAIFRLRVKNTGNRPTGWSSGGGQTALRLGDDIYSADSSTAAYSYAYNTTGDPGLEGSVELQPGSAGDAWVAFDIPARRVTELDKAGAELLAVDFEESLNGYNAASESAQVRGTFLLSR
jgi:hypothetical protein